MPLIPFKMLIKMSAEVGQSGKCPRSRHSERLIRRICRSLRLGYAKVSNSHLPLRIMDGRKKEELVFEKIKDGNTKHWARPTCIQIWYGTITAAADVFCISG